MMDADSGGAGRWLAAVGALLAALAIGLSAYAAHGLAPGKAQDWLQTAALYAFAHGLVLAVLAPRADSRLARWAAGLWLMGVVLFSGSLAGAALWNGSTRLAPAGGIALMAGWLVWAAAALRR